VDVALVIRQRLEEMGLEQRDLARAAHVTESYISQLLTGKKAPPAPHRTDIYDRLDRFLKLPAGELAKVAARARQDALRREMGDAPQALFPHVREVILRTCRPEHAGQIRAIIERQPFGELERLIARTLLEVAGVGAGTFQLTARHAGLLEERIALWSIDLATLTLEVTPRGRGAQPRRFEFVERNARLEPGLEKFLADSSLSGSATAAELEFLKGLRFRDRRPTAFYYYRELQNLRDALHFERG
jgi:transcriptional regulator with XRE-family HTH domain